MCAPDPEQRREDDEVDDVAARPTAPNFASWIQLCGRRRARAVRAASSDTGRGYLTLRCVLRAARRPRRSTRSPCADARRARRACRRYQSSSRSSISAAPSRRDLVGATSATKGGTGARRRRTAPRSRAAVDVGSSRPRPACRAGCRAAHGSASTSLRRPSRGSVPPRAQLDPTRSAGDERLDAGDRRGGAPSPTVSIGTSESARSSEPWLPPPRWWRPARSSNSQPGAAETSTSPAFGLRERGSGAHAPVRHRRRAAQGPRRRRAARPRRPSSGKRTMPADGSASKRSATPRGSSV